MPANPSKSATYSTAKPPPRGTFPCLLSPSSESQTTRMQRSWWSRRADRSKSPTDGARHWARVRRANCAGKALSSPALHSRSIFEIEPESDADHGTSGIDHPAPIPSRAGTGEEVGGIKPHLNFLLGTELLRDLFPCSPWQPSLSLGSSESLTVPQARRQAGLPSRSYIVHSSKPVFAEAPPVAASALTGFERRLVPVAGLEPARLFKAPGF